MLTDYCFAIGIILLFNRSTFLLGVLCIILNVAMKIRKSKLDN